MPQAPLLHPPEQRCPTSAQQSCSWRQAKQQSSDDALTPACQEQEPSNRNPKTNQRETLQNVAGAPDRSSEQGCLLPCALQSDAGRSGVLLVLMCQAHGPPAETSPKDPPCLHELCNYPRHFNRQVPSTLRSPRPSRKKQLPTAACTYTRVAAARPKEPQGGMKQHEGRFAFMAPRAWTRAPTSGQ